MKLLIAILLLLTCLTAYGEESPAFEEGYIIPFSKEQSWIISNELIKRLDLKPSNKTFDLCIEGEDGNLYSWCEVLKAHMDWVEGHK